MTKLVKISRALKTYRSNKLCPKAAVELVKSYTKFDSTVEVAFKLGVNPKC